MKKRTKEFATILQTNKKVISRFYYKYIFLIIILSCIFLGILFYRLDAHIVLFGDTSSALGEYVKTVATVLGGALVLLGLWINNRRVAEQIRQNNISEKAQLNTRFKDAATLLGSENVSSILSGIYALNQIALEASIGDKRQRGYVNIVHDILCAYVRENTDTITNQENGKAWRVNKKPAIVIQTVMKVLFKNDGFIYSNLNTDLSDCVIEDVILDEAYMVNVDFSRTKFIRATMKNATLISCFLTDSFIDDVKFESSVFKKVIFDCSHIRNTSFVDSQMQDCDFWDVILSDVNMTGVHFVNADFKDAVFEKNVVLKNTLLEDCANDEIVKNSKELTKAKL